MGDLKKEIVAYSLQNALEFGKADVSKILPKLFQHGLKKEEIGKIMPIIKQIVTSVNGKSEAEKVEEFEKLKEIVKKREYVEKELPELPGIEGIKKPIFRVAPFPSGALHLGNAKTFLLNALYAEKYGGEIILVMDDTIGSVEKPLVEEGYKLIKDAFKWLGIKYKKIVYKSDRLKIYYKYGEELIEKNKAYVCHCDVDTLRANRKKGVECGCRQFPPGIQLARWKEMFDSGEGSAVVRIKTEMTHKNPAFRDRVLFKISDRKHPRVGNKYRVWPSLEMSWAVDDHELGITHIIRGSDLLMETEMERYMWDIFKWDYSETIHTGKIAIAGVTIAKSKAQKEVLSGEFVGWDDPRTWSIQSLERRGIKAKSIREFVKEIGLNKQDITVPIEVLYAINRRALDEDALRYSFIEAPIKLEIENEMSIEEIEVPIHPHKDETRKVKIEKDILISEDDWTKYKGKEIRLLHLFNIALDDKTKITSVENKKIPKINWVSETVKTEIFMPNGETIFGLAESSIKDLKVGEMIQFERFGFVRYDGKKDENYKFWFAHK